MFTYSTAGVSDNYAYKPFVSTPISSGVVYLSFLLNVTAAVSSTNCEAMGLADGTSAGPKVLIGKTTTGFYKIGTVRGKTSSADYKYATAPTQLVVGTVYLIVSKYDFATQESSVFINPPIGSTVEPSTPEAIDNISTTIRTQLSSLWFRNNNAKASNIISGARVSTSWAAAVAIPAIPLSVPVVGSAGSITNYGFTANWTVVANASSYDVAVYQGTTLVSTTNASGQATQSVAITGLSSSTSYTYTVVAKGDGLVYRSSDPSSASAGFNTVGLPAPAVGTASLITSSGFTANWSTVTNATGYDVQVYLLTTLVSTTNVSGQAATSLAITGLSMGTAYTYKVVAKGDGSTYLDSSPSVASAVFVTTALSVNTINTNFGDGTWGTVTPPPASLLPGVLYTFSVNGFSVTDGVLYGSIPTGLKGEIHTNVMRLNKNVNSKLEFPTVNSLKQIEIHVSGSDTKDFLLKEYNSGTSAFDISVGTFTLVGTDENIFIIPITRDVPTKFRIENNQTNSLNINQVITRTTNPTLLSIPTIGVASDIVGNGFTANWTPNDANATGYKVFVYATSASGATTTLRNTFTASGQATNSFVVTGIDTAANCTYKVVALGDDYVLFSDSYQSAASAIFTVAGIPTEISDQILGDSSFKVYPNPVSENLNIEYNIQDNANVQLVLFNINSQAVSTLISDKNHMAGSYTKTFDVSGLKPGIYFARLMAGRSSKTVKIVINR
ncbi:MAG: T9SS type A sorting domain-containing protein [Bacteroidia bacterium]|nr:T9SS type A sorting domain-containing protein [Bacteroidia bacterium]